jgi:hypothetical protein
MLYCAHVRLLFAISALDSGSRGFIPSHREQGGHVTSRLCCDGTDARESCDAGTTASLMTCASSSTRNGLKKPLVEPSPNSLRLSVISLAIRRRPDPRLQIAWGHSASGHGDAAPPSRRNAGSLLLRPHSGGGSSAAGATPPWRNATAVSTKTKPVLTRFPEPLNATRGSVGCRDQRRVW